jgi:hypothetical protein
MSSFKLFGCTLVALSLTCPAWAQKDSVSPPPYKYCGRTSEKLEADAMNFLQDQVTQYIQKHGSKPCDLPKWFLNKKIRATSFGTLATLHGDILPISGEVHNAGNSIRFNAIMDCDSEKNRLVLLNWGFDTDSPRCHGSFGRGGYFDLEPVTTKPIKDASTKETDAPLKGTVPSDSNSQDSRHKAQNNDARDINQ